MILETRIEGTEDRSLRKVGIGGWELMRREGEH
jgi:hypothetical protein